MYIKFDCLNRRDLVKSKKLILARNLNNNRVFDVFNHIITLVFDLNLIVNTELSKTNEMTIEWRSCMRFVFMTFKMNFNSTVI